VPWNSKPIRPSPILARLVHQRFPDIEYNSLNHGNTLPTPSVVAIASSNACRISLYGIKAARKRAAPRRSALPLVPRSGPGGPAISRWVAPKILR